LQAVVQFLDNWVFFTFSDKLKFAIKVSISITLAFMVSFYMSWSPATTAVITIILIVSAGGVSDSIILGILRAIGTVLGAILGMILIGLFPQERLTYLVVLSITVFIIVYLYNTYQGDKTIFMLILVTVLMIFKDGEVDETFLYGVDKVYMTLIGIAIYGIVGILLWPSKEKNSIKDDAIKLHKSQLEYFESFDNAQLKRVFESEVAFQKSYKKVKNGSYKINFDGEVWENLNFYYKDLNKTINLISMQVDMRDDLKYSDYVVNYEEILTDIKSMLILHQNSWKNGQIVEIKESLHVEYNEEQIKKLSDLKRANVISFIKNLSDIHVILIKISRVLNSINSDIEITFDKSRSVKSLKFIWLDVDSFTGALQSFLIFWFATAFWIYFNPVGGFKVVALATILSVITTNSPVKPSLLTILFTFGFIFATLMYIFVLPNLVYSWELALFILVYTFFAFYLINPKITIFFLMGMFVLDINNTMNYNFGVFLNVLLVFYLFLSILMIFYYVPFTTKPEILFLKMRKRFFKHAENFLKTDSPIAKKHHISQMKLTLNKMKLWGSKIDTKYFDKNSTDKFLSFAGECEVLFSRISFLKEQNSDNKLLEKLKEFTTENRLLDAISSFKVDFDGVIDENVFENIEIKLKEFKNSLKLDSYSMKDIVEFYLGLGLYQSSWLSVIRCHKAMQDIDWENLREKKFL